MAVDIEVAVVVMGEVEEVATVVEVATEVVEVIAVVVDMVVEVEVTEAVVEEALDGEKCGHVKTRDSCIIY